MLAGLEVALIMAAIGVIWTWLTADKTAEIAMLDIVTAMLS